MRMKTTSRPLTSAPCLHDFMRAYMLTFLILLLTKKVFIIIITIIVCEIV